MTEIDPALCLIFSQPRLVIGAWAITSLSVSDPEPPTFSNYWFRFRVGFRLGQGWVPASGALPGPAGGRGLPASSVPSEMPRRTGTAHDGTISVTF